LDDFGVLGLLNYKPMPTLKKRKRKTKEQIRSNNVVVKNPTSKSTWKAFERKVASMFSTRRVPLSGSNSGHGTNSDSLHERVYIECKVRASFSLWELYEDTKAKAKVEKKVPIVAIKKKGAKGCLFLIAPEDMKLLVHEMESKTEK
jgi:hypothetical protein